MNHVHKVNTQVRKLEIVQETFARNLEIIKEGRRILSFLMSTTPNNDLLVVLLLYFL